MTALPDFTSLTTPRALGAGEFEADIPDGWQQGRGAFGGLVLATMVRAIRHQEPEPDRALRSLTAEIVGPVLPGPARLRVEVLRRGSGVSALAARLLQGDELLAHAVAVLGRDRVADRNFTKLSPPQLPSFRDRPPAPVGPPIGPHFARFCEFWPTGPLPYGGGSEPIVEGWFRFRYPGPHWDEAELVAAIDGYWPGVLAIEASPRPAVTVAFTFQALRPASELPRDQPLLYRSRALAGRDGYVVEQRELWSEPDTLVALNQQTFALIK